MYRILVVDDEQIERDGICFLLREQNAPFEIITQKNGAEAFQFLKGNKVDVILSDIKMPFMNGLELCTRARELYPEIRVIILTAYIDFEYTKKAIQIQVDDYLLKPIIPVEFESIISRVLQKLDANKKQRQEKLSLLAQYRLATPQAKEALLAGIMQNMKESLGELGGELYPEEKRLVQEVLEIVRQEYQADLSLSTLADRLHVSKGYLSSLFKKQISLSVMQYITMMRMQKAQQFLSQSHQKVSEIAKAVGYHDVSYFGLIFKKVFGMTPAQFRNGEHHEK